MSVPLLGTEISKKGKYSIHYHGGTYSSESLLKIRVITSPWVWVLWKASRRKLSLGSILGDEEELAWQEIEKEDKCILNKGNNMYQSKEMTLRSAWSY